MPRNIADEHMIRAGIRREIAEVGKWLHMLNVADEEIRRVTALMNQLATRAIATVEVEEEHEP